MATIQVKDKYYLRSIHEEIGLYDRKLAHLLKFDSFPSDKDRDVAAGKLSSKRDLLVRDAVDLVEAGIEYKPSELPRSLRTPEQIAAESAIKVPEQPILTTPADPHKEAAGSSPSSDTVPYFRKEIEEYMQKRRGVRVQAPAARKSS
jgi:hypothetical protein